MIHQLSALALLLINWLGIYGLCRELAARKQIHSDWRVSWLLACVGFGALLTFIVELSSSRRMLNAPTLIVAWLAGGIILCGAAGWLAWRRGAWARRAVSSWRERFDSDWRQNWPVDAKLMFIASVVLILMLGVIAASAPTTNLDSLTYHLPRVMHWIQQQSVEHYPTGNTRQLEFAPWSAFVITNLHLLQGNDALDNLVQWFAMLTCVIVTSFIAQQLLANGNARSTADQESPDAAVSTQRRVTALTCFMVATLPIGLVEAITTQTDYVVTCWFACLTCLTLALWNEPANFWYALGAGLALALGVLSKATMCIYAAPVGLALALRGLACLPNNPLRLRLALSFAIPFLAIDAPHLLRNYNVFGSPLGSHYILSIERNKTVSIAGTCSNVIRNLVLETNSGISPLTKFTNNFLLWLHRLTGRDLNDPDITYHTGPFFVPRGFTLDDSYASSFYHLLLIIVAGVLVLRRPGKYRLLLGYGLTMAIGFLLFCAFLRWQLWHTRIHLAWLVLLCPWATVILTMAASRWFSRIGAVVVAIFAIYCLPSNTSLRVFDTGWTRLPRERQYVTVQGGKFYAPLELAAKDIISSNQDRVGLKLGFDDPEYSIWIMLQYRGFTGRLDHILVNNESARIPAAGPAPRVVIASITNVAAALTNMFPYECDYGPVRTFWSEPASHWSELAQCDSTGEKHRLPPQNAPAIPFGNESIDLYLRTPRSGTLHLAGFVMDAGGKPVGDNSMRITTDSGFDQILALQGQSFSARISSVGGTCKMTLTLVNARSNHAEPRLEKLQWRWETEENASSPNRPE